MYELYLVGRLLEELTLADTADDPLERAVHLQACRYYRDLLTTPHGAEDESRGEAPAVAGTHAPR